MKKNLFALAALSLALGACAPAAHPGPLTPEQPGADHYSPYRACAVETNGWRPCPAGAVASVGR